MAEEEITLDKPEDMLPFLSRERVPNPVLTRSCTELAQYPIFIGLLF